MEDVDAGLNLKKVKRIPMEWRERKVYRGQGISKSTI